MDLFGFAVRFIRELLPFIVRQSSASLCECVIIFINGDKFAIVTRCNTMLMNDEVPEDAISGGRLAAEVRQATYLFMNRK